MVSNYLQIPGLISGLSTQDIIDKMMSIERMPLTRLQDQKDQQQKKADALKDIKTRLVTLLSKLQSLNLRSTVDAKSVTTDTPSSSPTIVTASAGSDAALGSFRIRVQSLATATTVSSGGATQAIGNAVQANQPLASAGFGIAPTVGTFTVNGAQVTIDSSTVLSDGVDAPGSNTIVAKIQDATAAAGKPVTVTLVNDADGRPNKLQLSAASAIQLGSGSDTSNFLTVAGLAALPPATTMTSARNLGAVNPSALLNSASANLGIALAATGSFKINGVEIAYDTSKDTLNNVISRINASAANVTASYDSATDRMTLTAKNTGGALIGLEDVGGGNFLAAMKLATANETVGQNAAYYLNDEASPRYSTSNTVTDAIPSVSINLKKADPATVTVTVSQNTSATVTAVQDFVSQYNSVMSLIRDSTAYNADTKKAGILTGDATIEGIESTLSILVSGAGDGLSSVARSFADIGISTGPVGTAPGQTDTLILDSAKLTAKLQSNPSAVADLFSALTANVTLAGGGTGSIASVSGTPTNHTDGTYSIVSDALGNLTSTFTPTAGGVTTKTGTITASGINTTLIPGVTLTAKGVLAAGTDTITVSFTAKGVGVKLADYLASLTSANGVFAERQDSADKQIAATNKSIQDLEDRLDVKEKALEAKFSALEVALARLQDQGAALGAQLAKMAGS